MKIEWSRAYIMWSIVLLLGVLALYLLADRLYIHPVREDLAVVKDSLETEETILTTLQKKKTTSVESFNEESSRDIQRKLPVEPVIDQFFIALERSEIASNSLVTSFKQEGSNEINISKSNQEQTSLEKGTSVEEKEEEMTSKEASEENIVGVNQMNVQLSVQSPNFSQLVQFLQELKSLPRMVDITSVSFNDTSAGEEKEQAINTSNNLLQYEVAVSIFYDSSNAILVDELPQYHYGSPSFKDNPLIGASSDSQ
ncbi:hypothetical protein ACFFGV_02460 [Pontibacillus salicampi]|uniref:Pilus assembly protein PilO n=1 Tax=Pontibacillus salicampi TaxID=1449801 RepID=A0ABV6LJF3_9BACI